MLQFLINVANCFYKLLLYVYVSCMMSWDSLIVLRPCKVNLYLIMFILIFIYAVKRLGYILLNMRYINVIIIIIILEIDKREVLFIPSCYPKKEDEGAFYGVQKLLREVIILWGFLQSTKIDEGGYYFVLLI